ncbi:MAG TPA: pitrilysin family protein [Longimicrobiales bacterium]|nr:pitrilysin family protein [Longimicrobiales bacterium]
MRRSLPIALALVTGFVAAPASTHAQAEQLTVPVTYDSLDNGLRIVLSEDHSAPTATVAVYYNIGFRIEPRDRTGFAHLFEHMMFQGSRNLGKNEFIQLVQSNGGVLNGSTRFDHTNYFQVVPAHTLETMLWAEADRMKGLDITQENLTNQQGVVANEVKVNVLNQPYGGFPWLDLPQYANENWHNAHNFYGDLADLEAATLEDVQSFFRQYYAPNNAVLVVVGDFDPQQTMAWIRQYFGPIPAVELEPKPDITEPRQTEEKQAVKQDPLANRPALALGYHMPAKDTPEYYAMALIDQILAQGRDSRLYQALVQDRAMTSGVSAGANFALGNMFNINGPTLYSISLLHDETTPAASIVAAIDSVITDLQTRPVDPETLDLALVKMRSWLYSNVESGFGRADLLAAFALFDDDPGKINRIEDELRKVTPELIMRTAREYLRTTNRTVLRVENRPAS